MNKLQFDVEVAKKCGVIPATLLDSIRRWIEYNIANNQNFIDGKYWAFNSKEAWAKQFPCFSYDQVRRGLEKLKKEGLVETGRFNKVAFDQTLWYTLTPLAIDLLYGDSALFDWAKLPHPSVHGCPMTLGKNAQPIPSIKQSIKPYIDSVSPKVDTPTTSEPRTKKASKKAFIPPTLEEVKQYIASKGYTNIDAERFIAYYEANNWRDSKNQPVKNWKQRVVSWAGTRSGNQNQKATTFQPQPANPVARVDTSGLDEKAAGENNGSFFDEFIRGRG